MLGTSGSGPHVVLTGNVLTNNDSDEDQPAQPLSVVSETVSSTGGGTATINSDGSFTFVPGVGDKNLNDTFTYHVTDGTATASGTVTVGIANALVWYVDNAQGSNGDGRSSSPFNSLGGINAAGGTGDSDGSGDILFLYQGSGNYTGGLPLEANQQLLGQPNGLTVNNGVSNVTLVSPSGSRPTITNSSNNGITLGTGNTIRSLNVGNASNFGISGSSFGTLDVADTGINSNGQALSLSTGTLSANGFTGVSSSGGTNNVSLSGVGTSGTFSLGSGTLSGASSDAFKVIGSGSFSYSGNVSQANSGAPLVSVSGGHNGTLTFGTGTLSATGGTGLQVDNADGTYNFNGTTTLSGGDAGIDILNGSTGTFSFGTGTAITNPSGTAFNLSGATASNATVTYSGNISKNNAGPAINIDNHDANTITFQTGTLSSTGTSSGIRVQNSNGGTINFNQPTKTLNTGTNTAVALSTNTGGTMNFGGGGLDIDATSGAGFSATGGGTVTVQTGTNANTIDTTTGTALNVSNTTIGAGGLTFRSISAGTGAGSAGNGIVLDTTGSSGGLTVSGTGAAGSGGTIQHKTGADGSTAGGIYLNSTANVTLRWMQLNDFDNSAIVGRSVTGFTLSDSVVNGTIGTASGPVEGPLNFGLPNPGGTNGLLGTGLIHNTKISGGVEHNVEFYNQSGTMNLTIDGTNPVGVSSGDCEIKSNSAALGSDGVLLETQGSATATVAINRCFFDNNKSQAVQMNALDSSTLDATISNSRVAKTSQGNEGFILQNAANGDLTAHITGNTLSGILGTNIFVGQTAGNATASSSLTAVIKSNTMTVGALGGPYPTNRTLIFFPSSTTGQVAPANVLIEGNTINTFSDPVNGIAESLFVSTPDSGRAPSFTATVKDNVVYINDPAGTSLRGIALQSTQNDGATGSNGCFRVSGNDVNYSPAAPAGVNGLRVRQAGTGVVRLEQGVSSGAPATVLAANNPLSTTEVVGTVTVVPNGTCLAAPT